MTTMEYEAIAKKIGEFKDILENEKDLPHAARTNLIGRIDSLEWVLRISKLPKGVTLNLD